MSVGDPAAKRQLPFRPIHGSMVGSVCGVQLKDGKRAKDVMLMFSLNETTDQLDLANSDCWYGHVLRREGDHVFRWALDFAVGQRKKWWSKGMRKKV